MRQNPVVPSIVAAAAALALCIGFPTSSGSAADLGPTEASGADHVHPFFKDRVLLQVGAARSSIDSSVTIGREGVSRGSDLSMEDDLGFDPRKTTIDALARFRISDRWSLELAYSEIERDSSASISRAIEVGRLEFPASASVDASFDMSALRLALGYGFYTTDQSEIGVALSLFTHRYAIAASGLASIGGVAAGFQTETFSVVAPIPTLGLYAHHALTPKWLVSGRIDFMDMSLPAVSMFGYDLRDVSGRIFSTEFSTEYRLLDELAIGLSYRYEDGNFAATTSGLRGSIDYTISSPIAFVRTSF